MDDNRITVSGYASAEFTEKRSTFIGYTDSVETAEQAEAFVETIKKKNSDARHNVWAYLLDGGVMRYSDDGEPQGTGGLPVLEVIKKSRAVNTVVVVTRYFGGILLGAPGLVRAYSKAASMTLEAAGLVTYSLFCDCELVCDYAEYDKLLYEIGRFSVIPGQTEYADGVTLRFSVRKEEAPLLCRQIMSVTNARRSVSVVGERYERSEKIKK